MVQQSVSDNLFRRGQVIPFDEVVEVLGGSLRDPYSWILRQGLDGLLSWFHFVIDNIIE